MPKRRLLLLLLVAIIAVGIMLFFRETIYVDQLPPLIVTPTQSLVPTQAALTLSPTSSQTPIEKEDIINIGLFDYNRNAPLDITEAIIEQPDEAIIVHQLTYKGGGGCRTVALLVIPTSQGLHPAVIYLHKDLGHGKTFKFNGNKEQFLDEAKLLAHYGVVSLLLDAPFLNGCGDVHDQREGYIRQVIDVRRGIDILEELPNVDTLRIGFVGHNYGATWGGVIAGVEDRIKTYILMGGNAFARKSCCHITNHIAETYDMEPYLYVSRADNTPILFMAAKQDQYFSNELTWLYYNSANEPKSILWYETGNYELQEAGMEDRLLWLSKQLGFDYSP